MKAHERETAEHEKIKLRKKLNADTLLANMRDGFEQVKDHRPGKVQHTLADTFMAGFAIFSLKAPSLQALDDEEKESPITLKPFTG